MDPHALPPLPLPAGIRTRHVDNGNGLAMHLLEAGWEGAAARPCVLLLHGFPELAYSWRKLMLPLAAQGFHVVAPDQRGYGRTTGSDDRYDGDLAPYRMLNLVRDALGLVFALGHRSVAAVVGHDFGSPVAAWCALVRPDVFRSVVLMSAPFAGPPAIALGPVAATSAAASTATDVHADLAALQPPRKHYQWYYSTPEADGHMRHAAQGLHAFLRGYYHVKSADWPPNQPCPLKAWSATELAQLPTYYVMRADQDMAQTVAPHMPTAAQVAACEWLTEDELAVYAAEYARTGFQGGLQWYRCGTSGRFTQEMQTFSGRSIDVPALYIAGRQDWGIYQKPGDFEAMQARGCSDFRGAHLLPGAGHWVQQEQPVEVARLLIDFI